MNQSVYLYAMRYYRDSSKFGLLRGGVLNLPMSLLRWLRYLIDMQVSITYHTSPETNDLLEIEALSKK